MLYLYYNLPEDLTRVIQVLKSGVISLLWLLIMV
jgi:hypothetical protein